MRRVARLALSRPASDHWPTRYLTVGSTGLAGNEVVKRSGRTLCAAAVPRRPRPCNDLSQRRLQPTQLAQVVGEGYLRKNRVFVRMILHRPHPDLFPHLGGPNAPIVSSRLTLIERRANNRLELAVREFRSFAAARASPADLPHHRERRHP
jgi:hypothetical protein